MATFFVFKIRTSCAECGEGMVLEGPRVEAKCAACDSDLRVLADSWKNIFSFRSEVNRCSYCQCDSFLPDPLWRALHPVRKRTPFFVAFR